MRPPFAPIILIVAVGCAKHVPPPSGPEAGTTVSLDPHQGAPVTEPVLVAPPPPPPPPLPVCVVLSVGSEQGLAHIGVLRALRERNVPIDCVVGTSMGAVVGGMYAAAPEVDVAVSYGQLAEAYARKARADGGDSLWFGAIMGGALGMLMVASGGTAAVAWAGVGGAGAGAMTGLGTFSEKEWTRLNGVLRTQYDGVTIESLPVRFGTVFQVLAEDESLRLEKSGSLSAAMGSSIRNPLLFKDVKVSTGSKFDPGFDRVAAIPVQDACTMFPGRQLVVSSVWGDQVFVAPNLPCPYQLVVVEHVQVDQMKAMSALEPDFGSLIDVGYQAALKGIDWERLPNTERPPSLLPEGPPISEVDVTLMVEVNPRKPGGLPWDGMAPLPDVKHRTKLLACLRTAPKDEVCDGYGTSAGMAAIKGTQREDTLSATWSLGRLRLREGMVFEVELIDGDLSDDDPIGKFTVPFSRAGGGVAIPGEAATVTLLFGEASGD